MPRRRLLDGERGRGPSVHPGGTVVPNDERIEVRPKETAAECRSVPRPSDAHEVRQIGGGLAETGFRDWYLEAVKYGFENRAAPFYKERPIPPHDPTTTFEWAIGGDSSAAFGAARKAMDAAMA